MEREILKADKQYRKRLFTAYLIGIAVISLCLYFGLPRYSGYLDKLIIENRLGLAEIFVMLFLACFIGPAGYIIVVGRRIMVAKRFPWHGQKVIHDTKIIEGRKAVIKGRMLFSLGIFTIIIIIAGAARTHYIFEKIRNFNFF
jgi:cytochrome bd-type quinol oxidase subunit 1